MDSVIFISEGTELNASVSHRCVMISDRLQNYNYSSTVLTSGTVVRLPNIFNQIKNYKKALKEKPDIVVIHRTSNLVDYHMIKKLKKQKIRIIYDYDDALFHIRLPGRFIAYSHINKIITLSDAVTAGNHYLVDYAKKFNENVFLLPTPVDNELFRPYFRKCKNENKIIIGWLGNGTDFQLRYLKILKQPLSLLAKKYKIKFRIISALSRNVKKEFQNENYEVDYGFDKWVPLKEIPKEISDFDIGVMPLIDEPFANGKCAMKALEYMSMGIPVVASPVGENKYVIKNGYNGFLALEDQGWIDNLEKLIIDNIMRKKIGKNAHEFVKENYSLKVVVKQFIDIIEHIL
jgi:glycosyltransferase involved in cell wall biosynthesis